MTVSDATDLGAGRGHAILPHTADAGVSAHGPTLAVALEELALALAELTADVPPGSSATISEGVSVRASDEAGLLVAWLNELIGLMDLHHAALVAADVVVPDPARPALVADIGLLPYADGARPRVGVKSATFHRTEARRDARGWHLRAYLDV